MIDATSHMRSKTSNQPATAVKRKPARHRFFSKLLLGTLLATFLALLHVTPFVRQIENRYGLGLLYTLRGPIAPPQGAMIAAIDTQSINWLRRISTEPDDSAAQLVSCLPPNTITDLEQLKGPSSLPRPIYSCLLRELKRIGFPVVAFDILFAAPGPAGADKMLADEMRNHGATAILSGYERFAIERDGAKVVVERNKQPLPIFKENAAATGSFLVPRTGGFVHGYIPHVEAFEGSRTLSDSARALLQPDKQVAATNAKLSANFRYFWLYGPPGTITTVPIRDILRGAIPAGVRDTAQNTVVFVGASDPSVADFEDSFPSLFRNDADANIGGVELIATAFLNAQTGQGLNKLTLSLEVAIVVFIALALSVVAIFAVIRNVLVIAGLAMAYLVAAWLAFAQYRLALPISVPIFLALPIFVLLALILRSKTAIDLIKRLAPGPVARKFLARPSTDRGQVETSDATVVFFDIIGSTRIGEQLGTISFGNLMNDFHDAVSREVKKRGGYVTVFKGDGATVLFDIENAGPEHPILACRAAVATIQNIRRLNLENAKLGVPALGVRAGMSSGQMGAGSIGGEDRFNFDVVGDVVNIAARLEQLGKTLFPGRDDVILVALPTHQRVKAEGFSFDDCGLQPIPGRSSGEHVFRLLVD